MVKAISFKKMIQEKGWNCWGEEHQAEGILTFISGEEIPCCLLCAKKKFSFKKNRRGKLLDTDKSLKITENSFIKNKEIATLIQKEVSKPKQAESPSYSDNGEEKT